MDGKMLFVVTINIWWSFFSSPPKYFVLYNICIRCMCVCVILLIYGFLFYFAVIANNVFISSILLLHLL